MAGLVPAIFLLERTAGESPMAVYPETAGEILSHAAIGTSDVRKARRFFDAVLKPLGLIRVETHAIALAYAPPGFSGANAPFWVLKPIDGKAATAGNGSTVAFNAPSREAVDAFHAAALASGGKEEGAPGIRENYHANYYGAYVRDLDDNKLCAVCHAAE
jgi:catechol 2,3-dioxygenase-like lactoylglutathione lyase family enzyme